MLIDRENEEMPITTQAQLLGVARSTVYYKPAIDSYNLKLMHLIDEEYAKTPFYGSRRMKEALKRKDYKVNRKRVQRLMRLMGSKLFILREISANLLLATKYILIF